MPTSASAVTGHGGVATARVAPGSDATTSSQSASTAKTACAVPSSASDATVNAPGSEAATPPSSASGVTIQLTTGIATALASGEMNDSW